MPCTNLQRSRELGAPDSALLAAEGRGKVWDDVDSLPYGSQNGQFLEKVLCLFEGNFSVVGCSPLYLFTQSFSNHIFKSMFLLSFLSTRHLLKGETRKWLQRKYLKGNSWNFSRMRKTLTYHFKQSSESHRRRETHTQVYHSGTAAHQRERTS